MSQTMALLTRIENDNNWFGSNFDALQEDYEKKFIAIKDGKVIETDSNYQKLIERLEQKKENPALLLIKFIHEKGMAVIL